MKSVLELARQFPLEGIQFPEDKATEGETLVGVLPDDLKRFWGFLKEHGEKTDTQIEALAGEIKGMQLDYVTRHLKMEPGDDHDHTKCREQKKLIGAKTEELNAIRAEFDKLKGIFWSLVKLEFDLDNVNLAIREGGQVVTWESPEEEEDSFSELGALLDMITRSEGGIPAIKVSIGPKKSGSGIGSALASLFGRH